MSWFQQFKTSASVAKTRANRKFRNSEFEDLDVAIVKATSEEESPPKEKHVRAILSIVYMDRQEGEHEHVLHKLGNRIRNTKSWIVVLKTLNVYHRILQTCSARARQQFIVYSRSSGVLDLRDSNDQRVNMSWELSAFARAYSVYLEERISSFQELHFDITSKDSMEDARELGAEELIELLPKMQIMLRRILACKPEQYAGVNFAMLTPLQLVVEESFQIFAVVSQCILRVVDAFFQLSRADCLLAIDIYKTAVAQSRELQKYYHDLSKTIMTTEVRFPRIQVPPLDFLDTMENHVRQTRRSKQSVAAVESLANPWAAYPELDRAPSGHTARPRSRTEAIRRYASTMVPSKSNLAEGTLHEAGSNALALPASRNKSKRLVQGSDALTLPDPPRETRKAILPPSSSSLVKGSRKSYSRPAKPGEQDLPQLAPSSASNKTKAIMSKRHPEGSAMAQLESLEDGITSMVVAEQTTGSKALQISRSSRKKQTSEGPDPAEGAVVPRTRARSGSQREHEELHAPPLGGGETALISRTSRKNSKKEESSAARSASGENKLVVTGRGRSRAKEEEAGATSAGVPRTRSSNLGRSEDASASTGYVYESQRRVPARSHRYQ